MFKNKQSGLGLLETIVILAVIAGLIFAVYYFAWGAPGRAGQRALEISMKTMQTAVGAYIINSNGRYPTIDGKLPDRGKNKLIMWDASFTTSGKKLIFYPDFIKRLPKHWNEGVWWIDDVGRVLVTIDPEDY